ncbi:hypothetical protein BpHYR1_022276 [Brachionus plicatilis]|uniref:Uncharacterized protein n=1 Tax=Brachionus plicatilis TaxID=10195 RepID=A0A3M7REU2_BRAPC|nr:hypothetical protein BpHYR1_022276 [Brachionus plicatilis]
MSTNAEASRRYRALKNIREKEKDNQLSNLEKKNLEFKKKISNPENEVQIVNELFFNDDGASNNATQDTNCEMQPSTSDGFLVVDQELLQANNIDDLSEKRNDTKTELELIFEKNGREIENFLKESNSLIMTYDF